MYNISITLQGFCDNIDLSIGLCSKLGLSKGLYNKLNLSLGGYRQDLCDNNSIQLYY